MPREAKKQTQAGPPAISTSDARTLRKVGEAFREWGRKAAPCGRSAAEVPQEERDAARQALLLAVKNLGLINSAHQKYGCSEGVRLTANAFEKLSTAAAEHGRGRDLGGYWCWAGDLTQPQLPGNVSFPDELDRWASRLEQEAESAPQRDGKAEAVAAPLEGPQAAPPATVSDDAKMSVAELSKAFGVPAEALRKRLERLRRRDFTCFAEVPDPARKQPTFLYHVGKVRAVIEALKASVKASAKRPT